MTALKLLVPASQIVLGSDFPSAGPRTSVAGLRSSGVFTEAELQAIDQGNAVRLLARFRA